MNRRLSRETVFCLIFEKSFHSEKDCVSLYEEAVAAREIEENEYIRKTFLGVCEQQESIDRTIGEVAVGWSFSRLSRVTLSILQLCTYELLYAPDIPDNVAMNEAVELAKKYDHDSAPTFINGIINKISKNK